MAKKGPIRLELRWRPTAHDPSRSGVWETRRRKTVERSHEGLTKKEAIRDAASYARHLSEAFATGVVLVFCRKDGNYCKGHGAERSYGADNPRRPG